MFRMMSLATASVDTPEKDELVRTTLPDTMSASLGVPTASAARLTASLHQENASARDVARISGKAPSG